MSKHSKRVLRVWLHGRLKLCNQMNWNATKRRMYFGYYGRWPKDITQANNFLIQRSEDVRIYNLNEHTK